MAERAPENTCALQHPHDHRNHIPHLEIGVRLQVRAAVATVRLPAHPSPGMFVLTHNQLSINLIDRLFS
jgi:hypothetical protein